MPRTTMLLVNVLAFIAALTLHASQANAQEKRKVFVGASLTEEDLATLRDTAPNVRIELAESQEEALALAPEANGMDARFVTPEILDVADNLTWVQVPSAGVAWALEVEGLAERDDITMTNMRGVHAPTIAEHAFGMLLMLTRDLRIHAQDANRGKWLRDGSGAQPVALRDKTLLVVGLGSIGSEVASIGKGFGMRVLATKRRMTERPDYVDVLGVADALPGFLTEADVVAICVPLTDETRGMIGAEQLASMPEGSYIINVGRGAVIDTDALVASLESGHLAGACLDVTDPEPLPEDHPLWAMDNVFITPHVSSRSPLTSEVWKETYLENIRRFGAGEEMLNVVDKRAGY